MPPSPASILVREVADERLSHGERTFAAGLILVVGGGIVVLIGAPLLRMAGLL